MAMSFSPMRGPQSSRRSYYTLGRKASGSRLWLWIHDQCLKVSVLKYLFEEVAKYSTGKGLLRPLVSLEIPCTYVLLPSISSVMKTVTTVLIGAHSIHSDGAVVSRAGTALVAVVAKDHHIPLLVCCETYKYSESMHLDSFAKNELGKNHPTRVCANAH